MRSGVRRVVLDPNVLVSALISPTGAPAQVIDAVLDGDLDHVASPQWLSEANGIASRPRFRRWFTQATADALIERLWVIADIVPDPSGAAGRASDPHDDYLVALALVSGDPLVTGDGGLLALAAPQESSLRDSCSTNSANRRLKARAMRRAEQHAGDVPDFNRSG